MDVVAGGLIGAFAVLLSQLIAALAPRWNVKSEVIKQDSIESSQSRRKIYEEFVTTLFEALDGTNKGGTISTRTEQKLRTVFKNFRTRILLVGSDEVVRAFNDWDVYANHPETAEAGQDILAAAADLVAAMRRDLGYPKTDLKRIEILAVFLTDPETAEPAMAKPRKRRFANTKSL